MVLSGALFAFIILAWDKATGLSAEEKREIGILKAVGWETSDILLMKFWEGAAVSLDLVFHRHSLGLSAYFCRIRHFVRTCIKRMVGPLSQLQTHSIYQCLSDSDSVFFNGPALYRDNHYTVMALCNDRS